MKKNLILMLLIFVVIAAAYANSNNIYIYNGRHFNPNESPNNSFCKDEYSLWQQGVKNNFPMDLINEFKTEYNSCLGTYKKALNMYKMGKCEKADVLYKKNSQGNSCVEVRGTEYYYSDCDGIKSYKSIKL